MRPISQLLDKKETQRTIQELLTPSSDTDLVTSTADLAGGSLYAYDTVGTGSGPKFQQYIRDEVISTGGIADGFVIDAQTRTLWTWGTNDWGQLGDGTTDYRSSPVSVLLGCNIITAVKATTTNSYALDSTGVIWAWGKNDYGQVGDGTTTHRSSPVSLVSASQLNIYPPLGAFAALAQGWGSTGSGGGITTTGAAWTWGANTNGEVGDNTTTPRSSPVLIAGGPILALYRAGRYIDASNQAYAWGLNTSGQLGIGTTSLRWNPAGVIGSFQGSVIKMAVGQEHTLFLTATGNVYAVGANQWNQLGDGTTTYRSSPVSVPVPTSRIIDIAAGSYHSMALDATGQLWTWGKNDKGQLGTGSTFNYSISVPYYEVASPYRVASLNTGRIDSYNATGYKLGSFLDVNSYAWTWGYNLNYFSLGNGTTQNSSSPTSVVGGRQWRSFKVDLMVGSGIDINSYAWTWGYGGWGNLGDGFNITRSSPVSVVGGRQWSYLTPTYQNSVGLDTNGYAWQWGNINGVYFSSPISVLGGRRYSKLIDFVPENSGLLWAALDTNSYAWAWGNWYGWLGDGTTAITSSPVSVAGNIQWKDVQLAAGYAMSSGKIFVGLDKNGYAWTWGGVNTGNPTYGALGNNTNNALMSSPVSVVGGLQFTKVISSNSSFITTVALDTNGYAWAWGYNGYGEIGDGFAGGGVNNRSSPVSVVGGHRFTNVAVVQENSGYYPTMIALKADGTVWSWGSNWWGAIGDGTTSLGKSSPTSVLISGVSEIWGKHCAVARRGNFYYSWGQNSYQFAGNYGGAIGDNTTAFRSSPVAINFFSELKTALPSTTLNPTQFMAVGATEAQTFGLDTGGAGWAFGQNYIPQPASPPYTLFPGMYTNTTTSPMAMGFTDLNSYAWTWGWSVGTGVLGNNSTTTASSPVSVVGGIRWKQVTSGFYSSITGGLDLNSYAWMWGSNGSGQSGDGTTNNRSSPTSVLGGRQWSAFNLGLNPAALDLSSYAWQWGSFPGGAAFSSPVSVFGGRQFTRIIQTPFDYTQMIIIALDANSYAWTWGYGQYGALGNNATVTVSSPVSVFGNKQWKDIRCAQITQYGNNPIVLGLDTNGYLWTWGGGTSVNTLGYLGNGTTMYTVSSPVSVVGGRQYSALFPSGEMMAALDTSGYAWTWGYGVSGVLGNNQAVNQSSPVSVLGGLRFTQLGFEMDGYVGQRTTVGLTVGGQIWTWGQNYFGSLGNGTTGLASSMSSPISIFSSVTSMATRTGAIISDGQRIWAWGGDNNKYVPTRVDILPQYAGLLGDGTTNDRSTPRLLASGQSCKNKRGA